MRVQDASKALSQHMLKCSCGAAIPLDVLKRRWASCIMKKIEERGTLHFGALKRGIPGISKKVLTERLRDLEERRLLRRESKPAARPQMFYSLTVRGQELTNVLGTLCALGARWQHEDTNNSILRFERQRQPLL